MAYRLIRSKDGWTEQLLTIGRQFQDGRWYKIGEYPKGCSFSLPLVFDSLKDAARRLEREAEKNPSWNYEVSEYYR